MTNLWLEKFEAITGKKITNKHGSNQPNLALAQHCNQPKWPLEATTNRNFTIWLFNIAMENGPYID